MTPGRVMIQPVDEARFVISVHRWRPAMLLHGDAIEKLSLIPSKSVDLISADPPYYLSNGGTTCKSGKRASVNKGKWDASLETAAVYNFNLEWLRECQRVLKPTGTIFVSGTQHVIFSLGYALQRIGFHLLNTIAWCKPNASPNLACRTFAHASELVIWAAPEKHVPMLHTFNYQEMKAANGGKQMRDTWIIPTVPAREKTHGKHPTQKPLALLERIIWAASKPGDVVLDPFCGSGTTGVAALKHGRRFIGIDQSKKYLALTQRRLHAEMGVR